MSAIFTILLFANVMAWSDDAQASPPEANAPVKLDEQPAATDDAVDELLAKLEAAAADLRDFQADLRYDKWQPVTNRWEIRAGELLYEVKPDDTKRFAMLFDTLITGTVKRDQTTHYIYDDGWLVEINHKDKQFIKRQIVAPGKEFDPFKLGEGPFPLPIGQSREEVRKRFHVSLIAAPEDERLAGLENVEGLRLVPKPGTPDAEDFERVDVFYDKDTLLPVGIAVLEAHETPSLREKKIVRLRNVKRNEGIEPAKLSVEEPDPNEWAISIEPWRGED